MSSPQRVLISDVVQKYPTDTTYYIGGTSGFFYIGKDPGEDLILINFEHIVDLTYKYKHANNGGIRRKYDLALKRWIDIWDRPVREYYRRIEDGIAILLDESDDLIGRYWFKEEYEHEHEKN